MTRDLRCEDVIERLLIYLDRELDAVEEAEFERHLEACRGCFTRAEFERRLRQRVADAIETRAPPSLTRRVREMVSRY